MATNQAAPPSLREHMGFCKAIWMKKVILILFVVCFSCLFVVCFSCAEEKSDYVNIYGISFKCPPEWKVSNTEDRGAGKFISIEKNGAGSSGLVTMTFTRENFEPAEYLRHMQASFLRQKGFEGLVFQPARETYYGKHKGITSSYAVDVMSIMHAGEMYVFRENGITMCVVHQEATEDHKENLQGFETIKESLSLK